MVKKGKVSAHKMLLDDKVLRYVRIGSFPRNLCWPLVVDWLPGLIFCGHFWLSSDFEENLLLQYMQR